MELEHLPSEYTLLAAFHALTADFLDGQKTATDAVYCQGLLLEHHYNAHVLACLNLYSSLH